MPGGTGGHCRSQEERKQLVTYTAELEQKTDTLQALLDKALADLKKKQKQNKTKKALADLACEQRARLRAEGEREELAARLAALRGRPAPRGWIG